MLMFYLQMIETEEDQSKFETLYLTYRQTMYAVAFKILKHKEDSEDAVHNAFVRIAKMIREVDSAVGPRTKCFVMTVVERIAIDIVRKRTRRQEHESPLNEVGVTVAHEMDDVLANCIVRLKPEYRMALLLKYEYGYTLKEIAKTMHITEAKAKNLTYRARQKVAELYEKENVR